MQYKDFYAETLFEGRVNALVNELCNPYLFEGQIHEIDLTKVKDKVNGIIKKFGDTNIKVYLSAGQKISKTIDALQKKVKDPNASLMIQILSKIVRYIVSNPKLFIQQLRITLSILSLIGSALGIYIEGQNDILSYVFDKFDLVDTTDSFENYEMQLKQLSRIDDASLLDKIIDAMSKYVPKSVSGFEKSGNIGLDKISLAKLTS